MTELLFEDKASTTLVLPVAPGDTSMTVSSGSAFPSPSTGQGFYATVQEGSNIERMLITAKSGNIFSGITRGASPHSFGEGSTVKFTLDAEALASFAQKGTEREVAVDPNGLLYPLYDGEEVLLTTTNYWYKHTTGLVWLKMGTV